MTAPIHDGHLALAYTREGEESAFRALVARHIDLVFATALRQVGDHPTAQEITQNVFIALARKAPALARYETLAGWLHRTTVLEAKARIRGELRRRQREQIAAELSAIAQHGESPLQALVPFLDEALLTLREPDRLALISRFFEERSLRDVGSLLGVNEDAARKRVARALDRLASFFRQRGFALPAGAIVTTVFSAGTHAAPPALAAAAAQAGLAAGVGTSGITAALLDFMAFSKIRLAALGLLCASAPLLWQAKTQANLTQAQQNLAAQLQLQQENLLALTSERDHARALLHRATSDRFASEAALTQLRAQRAGQLPPPRYRWDDSAPLVRVPKTLLADAKISTLQDRNGRIRDELILALQLTPAETAELQTAITSFLNQFYEAQVKTLTYIPLADDDPTRGTPDEKRSFQVGDHTETMRLLCDQLFSSAQALLGPERFAIFHKGLTGWMPLDLENLVGRSVYGHEIVTPEAHTVTFRLGNAGQTGMLHHHVERPGSGFSTQLVPDQIPEMFAPYLQDWITLARAAETNNPQPAQP